MLSYVDRSSDKHQTWVNSNFKYSKKDSSKRQQQQQQAVFAPKDCARLYEYKFTISRNLVIPWPRHG